MRVATLNVRNTADRWSERRSHLSGQLVELAPHVIGLQELRSVPSQVEAIVGGVWEATERRMWFDHRFAPKTGAWGLWEGIAVLSRLPVVSHSVLPLAGQHRVAQRVTVATAGGGTLDFYNTHLAAGDRAVRATQAEALMGWIDQRRDHPKVLVGDFNSGPDSAAIATVQVRFRSAHPAARGREPDRTVPTPLRAGSTEPGRVIDYVFVDHGVEVYDAWISFDQPHPHDPGLFASDHFGVAATISARR